MSHIGGVNSNAGYYSDSADDCDPMDTTFHAHIPGQKGTPQGAGASNLLGQLKAAQLEIQNEKTAQRDELASRASGSSDKDEKRAERRQMCIKTAIKAAIFVAAALAVAGTLLGLHYGGVIPMDQLFSHTFKTWESILIFGGGGVATVAALYLGNKLIDRMMRKQIEDVDFGGFGVEVDN